MYYLCDYNTHKALAGPFSTWQEVVDLIEQQQDKERFCTASRFTLAKEGKYPKNKRGNAALEKDIRESRFEKEE